MLLHIGDDVTIRLKDLIAIIDASIVKTSSEFQKTLIIKYGRKLTERILSADTKSLVITTNRMYTSSISVITLRRRAQHSGIAESIAP